MDAKAKPTKVLKWGDPSTVAPPRGWEEIACSFGKFVRMQQESIARTQAVKQSR
jgi:hypothetical protein